MLTTSGLLSLDLHWPPSFDSIVTEVTDCPNLLCRTPTSPVWEVISTACSPSVFRKLFCLTLTSPLPSEMIWTLLTTLRTLLFLTAMSPSVDWARKSPVTETLLFLASVSPCRPESPLPLRKSLQLFMAITLQWTLSYANRYMNRSSPRTAVRCSGRVVDSSNTIGAATEAGLSVVRCISIYS